MPGIILLVGAVLWAWGLTYSRQGDRISQLEYENSTLEHALDTFTGHVENLNALINGNWTTRADLKRRVALYYRRASSGQNSN